MDLLVNVIVILSLVMRATDVMVQGSTIRDGSPLFLGPSANLNPCLIERHKTKLRYTCRDQSLESIPKKDTGIQVMDLTNNRLRRIEAGQLSRYGSLEILYLRKNILLEITEEMVSELPYLQELYLNDNVLHTISPSLFELPYLKTLYLTVNELKDPALTFNVTSQLETLVIDKNKLTRVPSMGIQPHMTYLNLSDNKIERVSTEDLARFCSLKKLDLTKNPIHFDSSSCDCIHFNSWAKIHHIDVTRNFVCNEALSESCSTRPYSNKTLGTYKRCLDLIKIEKAAIKARTTWISVGSCAGVVIFLLLVGLYCVCKRSKKRNRKIKEEQRLAANNANTESLNGNLLEELPVKSSQE